jgi:hypothetical protein
VSLVSVTEANTANNSDLHLQAQRCPSRRNICVLMLIHGAPAPGAMGTRGLERDRKTRMERSECKASSDVATENMKPLIRGKANSLLVLALCTGTWGQAKSGSVGVLMGAA